MFQSLICCAMLCGAGAPDSVGNYSEDSAVNRAARNFRIQTFEQYRLNRDVYDARRQAGDRLFEDWNSSGQPAKYRNAVVDWFQMATKINGTVLPTTPALLGATDSNIVFSFDKSAKPSGLANQFELNSAPVQRPTEPTKIRGGVVGSIGRALLWSVSIGKSDD